MAVSKKAKAIYMGFFDGMEIHTANLITNIKEQKIMLNNLDRSFSLSKAEEKEIKDFWKPYGGISTNWCRYYYSKNGIFDPRYIPNTLYFTKIDQHFNMRKLGWGFNDKNYYSCFFNDVKQPKTFVRKIGSLLFDEDYKLLTIKEAIKKVETEKEIIVKPSQESGSGRGISFYNTEKDIAKIIEFLNNKTEKDYVVQEIVKQHESLNNIYSKALNTIRITTLLMDDGVHILSSILRMGSGGSRVDNASNGGLSVGINPDGSLNKFGHILYKGTAVDHHPQGFVFEGFRISYFQDVIDTVNRLAQHIGNFRLVSWDMTVDKDGEVILIEANMRKGGIAIHQFNNGPLFGDLTKRVLNEVFVR